MEDRTNEEYPLSPLQQGMLFHALSTPASGVDIEQIIMTLDEEVDFSIFEGAWNRLLERHSILRSKFAWEGLSEPVQIVENRVALSIKYFDYGDIRPSEFEKIIQEYLEKDRVTDFQMTEAPLMRLAVFRSTQTSTKCIWTFHHILLDGRSFPLVLDELFAL